MGDVASEQVARVETRIYPDRAAFVAHQRAVALGTCEHGLTLADCDICTRYAGECDLGGCTRKASGYGINRDRYGRVMERRLICAEDADFARSLGMEYVAVDKAADHYEEIPEYDHNCSRERGWCQWGHISRWCPSGCNGEPTTYEAAVEACGLEPSR